MPVTHPRDFPDTILTECTISPDDGLVSSPHMGGLAGTQSRINYPTWTGMFTVGEMMPERRAMWESWKNSLNGRPFLATDTSKPEPLAYPLGHPATLAGTWDGTATIASLGADTMTLAGLPVNFITCVGDRISLVQNGRYGYYEVVDSDWTGPAITAGVGVTIAASNVTAPNLTRQAINVIESAANENHVTSGSSLVGVAGQRHTLAVHVHQSSTRMIELTALLTASASSVFNPVTGQFVTGSGFFDRGVETLRQGWSRVWMTAVSTSSGNMFGRVNLHNGTSISYSGNGVSGAVLWGQSFVLGDPALVTTPMALQVAPFINPIGNPIFTTAAQVTVRQPKLLMTLNPKTWSMKVDANAIPASFQATQVI